MDTAADRAELRPFVRALRADGAPDAAIRTFVLHLGRHLDGEEGLVGGPSVQPLGDLPDAEELTSHRAAGRDAAMRTAVIKLNGGLGTSMGLERAKSLLPVRDGLTFLDLIVRQVLSLRRELGAPVPLLLLNSFRTEEDTLASLSRYRELPVPGLPLTFLQHRVPKVLAGSRLPAHDAENPEHDWCPPGHGDVYTALASRGVLGRLLEAGFRYAFISNADNLGAVLDPEILGFMVEEEATFLMEAADRTPADRKGGHLYRRTDGVLALRELAQTPPEDRGDFQDVARHRYFNTNNLWVHLPTLRELLDNSDGALPLPTIVNRKTLDPRDPKSLAVVQLETAMGAAISLFPRAAAVRVSRRRFSPVKTTDDLLAVRSDAYRLTEDSTVVLDPRRSVPPSIRLDNRFYRFIDGFEERFPAEPPSLIGCETLDVQGNVTFSPGVVVRGRARIIAGEDPATLPPGVVTGTVHL